jgi:hypothetical protein
MLTLESPQGKALAANQWRLNLPLRPCALAWIGAAPTIAV